MGGSAIMNPSTSEDLADASVVILGIFPPPVTGAAKNNLLMAEDLDARGVNVVRVPTATRGSALKRSLGYHAKRFLHFFRVAWRLRRGRARSVDATLYCVPDGGLGLWYSAGYLALSRRQFRRIVLHHRTFQYIDRPSAAMRWIVRSLNDRITHVFLSEGMRDRFVHEYGASNSLVSTNARYVAPRLPAKSKSALVLGHLSNLCHDKGFFEVADTFEAVRRGGVPAQLHLAGPILDQSVSDRLDGLLAAYPEAVTYHGPLSGPEKDRFYDRVHLFLFPTRWRQEAQPNVIYEAFAGGAAVVSWGRGCIPGMIPDALGAVIAPSEPFTTRAAQWIEAAWADGRFDAGLVGAIHDHVKSEKEASTRQYQRLLALLTDE